MPGLPQKTLKRKLPLVVMVMPMVAAMARSVGRNNRTSQNHKGNDGEEQIADLHCERTP
jgi:hypothetical protein